MAGLFLLPSLSGHALRLAMGLSKMLFCFLIPVSHPWTQQGIIIPAFEFPALSMTSEENGRHVIMVYSTSFNAIRAEALTTANISKKIK